MNLKDYITEYVVSRRNAFGDRSLDLQRCNTMSELLDVLDRKSKELDPPTPCFSDNRKMLGFLSDNCVDDFGWAYKRFKDALKRPVCHYEVYIAKPKQNTGYVISFHNIPIEGEENEGEIQWKSIDGTVISEWSLDNMKPKMYSTFTKAGAEERIKVIEKI